MIIVYNVRCNCGEGKISIDNDIKPDKCSFCEQDYEVIDESAD
jgi:hypothetical protein